MARQPRFCPVGIPVHVIQRGNNRNACFASDHDVGKYARLLNKAAEKYGVCVHGWVFMTNHTHLLVTPQTEDGVSKLMHYIGTLYVRYFNHRYNRSGTLYEGRFRSCLVQNDDYFLHCLKYIELNPIRAGMVQDPADYRWSSYRCHAFGQSVGMWTPHALYEGLASEPGERQSQYRRSIETSIDAEVMEKIRHCLNTGLVLGSDQFREQIGRLRK